MMKILLSIMFIYSISFSQSKIGTSAVPFLGIGIGAKSLGMAGAYSAMSGKSESWYWNPSAVVLSTGLNTHVHSANWLVDTKISSFSISNSLNNSLVVGGYLNYLDYGKEIVTTLDEEFGTGDYWTASDFVIGTGKEYSVEEFAKKTFDHIGLNYKDYISIDEKLIRPAEVDTLLANYSKAKKMLNWSPEITFDELVVDMIESDLKAIGK